MSCLMSFAMRFMWKLLAIWELLIASCVKTNRQAASFKFVTCQMQNTLWSQYTSLILPLEKMHPKCGWRVKCWKIQTSVWLNVKIVCAAISFLMLLSCFLLLLASQTDYYSALVLKHAVCVCTLFFVLIFKILHAY